MFRVSFLFSLVIIGALSVPLKVYDSNDEKLKLYSSELVFKPSDCEFKKIVQSDFNKLKFIDPLADTLPRAPYMEPNGNVFAQEML